MKPSVVVHCGLRVRSEMELHLPPAADDSAVDLELVWGPDIAHSDAYPSGSVIAEYFEGCRRLYTAVAVESGFSVRFPGCGEFAIEPSLSTITVHRDSAGPHANLLPLLAAGTVLAIVHGLRGSSMLHASAVAVDGRALAFAGRSGQGKSTLAALLCSAGASLVSDDVLALVAGPEPMCLGGGAELRLRDGASELANDPRFQSRRTTDQRTAASPSDAITEALPLAAVVIPIPSRDATELEVVQLRGTAPLFALLAFPRVAGWVDPSVLSRQFSTLAAIAERVPVYGATIPWGPPFPVSVAPAILDLARRGAI